MSNWQFIEAVFDVRENASYAIGEGLFLVWGGAPVRSGDLRSDGLIVDIDTKTVSDVPDAPIPARYGAAAVKTPEGFILFGGYSFDDSFIDGAVFEPGSSSWSAIATAPFEPAANPSAVWAGSEMFVWLSSEDSEFASLPIPTQGQFAAYDPAQDSWRTLDSPPAPMTDAVLLYEPGQDRIVLVGGPPMRDLGNIGLGERVHLVYYDLKSDSWGEPVITGSPVTESAAAASGPDDSITVFTSPSIYLVANDEWNAAGPVHHCPWEMDATSGGGMIYLKGVLADSAEGCTIVTFDGSTDTMSQIIQPGAYGQIGSSFVSGFLAADDGRLVTFGDADPAIGGASGMAVIGTYTP